MAVTIKLTCLPYLDAHWRHLYAIVSESGRDHITRFITAAIQRRMGRCTMIWFVLMPRGVEDSQDSSFVHKITSNSDAC